MCPLPFTDLVANDTADNGTAYDADRIAARQYGARHRTGTGTYGRVGIPLRHAAAGAKTRQQNGGAGQAQRVFHSELPSSIGSSVCSDRMPMSGRWDTLSIGWEVQVGCSCVPN